MIYKIEDLRLVSYVVINVLESCTCRQAYRKQLREFHC